MNKQTISSLDTVKKADVLGVKVVSSDIDQVLRIIDQQISLRSKNAKMKPFFLTTVNVEFVMTALEDKEFAKILNESDMPLADGFGLRLADSKIMPIPGRKLTEKLVSLGKYRIFYLGGRGGVARKMSEKYRISKFEYRNDNWDEGSGDIKSEYRISKFETISNDKIVEKINKYRPDILLVAYGAPWQEKWIWRNLDKLNAGVVMGVGGTFDYLTGRASVPPEMVSKIGLEWLWRLIREPRRWRRQIKLINYVWKLMTK